MEKYIVGAISSGMCPPGELFLTPPSPIENSPAPYKGKRTNARPSVPTTPRKSSRTDEESRRLYPRSPGDYRVDPNAAPIPIPGTFIEEDTMPIGVPGGPKPINTLKDGSHTAQTSLGSAKGNNNGHHLSKNTRSRGTTSLTVQPIRGNNVPDDGSWSPHTGQELGRSSKRMKIDQTALPEENVYDICNSAEDADELAPDGKDLRNAKRPQGLNSQSSSVVRISRLNSPLQVQRENSREFALVEKMMDSGGYSKQSKRESNRAPHSSNLPIDFPNPPDPEASTKPRYEGTARPNATPRQRGRPSKTSIIQKQTGQTSNHFMTQITNDANNGQTFVKEMRGYETRVLPQRPESNLRDEFRRTDRRSRDLDEISSDELTNGPHDGEYAEAVRVRPEDVKTAELNSSSRAQIEAVTGLPKSNIPHSFAGSKHKQPDPHRLQKMGESNSAFKDGWSLNSIRIDGHYIQSDSMGLVLEGKEDFEIVKEGLYLSHQKSTSTCKILATKLRKLNWADSSRKIRLEMSLVGNGDNKIDLEFSKVDDCVYFNNLLRCDKVKRTSKYMDQAFERESHRSEHPAADSDKGATDLEVNGKRKAQRGESTELASSKRMRSNANRVVDRLAERDGQMPLNRICDMEVSEEHTARSGGIDDVLHSIKPRLTRSNRQSAADRLSMKELSPNFEAFPEEERYSRIHGLGPPWKKPLVYPREGKKKATVDHGDLERLDEGQFLNDNLVGFYLRYLESQLESTRPDMAKKVYWFNTYFFASLMQNVRGKKGINYDAVRKWTRNIDLLTYDYAVVPINESAHWYVVIICNLPALDRIAATPIIDSASPTMELGTTKLDGVNELQMQGITSMHDDTQAIKGEEPNELNTRESFAEMNIEDQDNGAVSRIEPLDEKPDRAHLPLAQQETLQEEEMSEHLMSAVSPQSKIASQKKTKRKSMPPVKTLDPDQPAIITLDSLGLRHPLTVKALKDYLHSEVRDKRGGMQWTDSQMKGWTGQHIPLQDNFCDCGLFLLEYMKKFVEDPKDFVEKLMLRQFDEKRDWPKLVSSEMRAELRDLVQGLHAEQRGEVKREKSSRRSSAAKVHVSEVKRKPEGLHDPLSNQPTELNFLDVSSKYVPEIQQENPASASRTDHPKTKEPAMSLDVGTTGTPIVILSSGRGDPAIKEHDSLSTTELDSLPSGNRALAGILSIDDVSQHEVETKRYHRKYDDADAEAGREMPSAKATTRELRAVIPDSQPSESSQLEKSTQCLEPETTRQVQPKGLPLRVEIEKPTAISPGAQTPNRQKLGPEATSLPSPTLSGKTETNKVTDAGDRKVIDITNDSDC